MLEDPKARHGWTPAVRIVASLKTFGKEKQWYFGMLQRGPFHKECAKHKPLSQLKFQPPATSTGSRDLQYIMECMWRGEAQKNKSCVTSISRQSTHFFQFYPYALDQYKLLLHLWLTLAQSLTQAHTHTHTYVRARSHTHTHACTHARKCKYISCGLALASIVYYWAWGPKRVQIKIAIRLQNPHMIPIGLLYFYIKHCGVYFSLIGLPLDWLGYATISQPFHKEIRIEKNIRYLHLLKRTYQSFFFLF